MSSVMWSNNDVWDEYNTDLQLAFHSKLKLTVSTLSKSIATGWERNIKIDPISFLNMCVPYYIIVA